MGVRENNVETYFDEQVELIGGITRKWVSPGRDGVTDRIAVIYGTVIFVEVKPIGGYLEPHQVREHKRLEAAGAIVRTVYGHKQVDVLIEWIVECYC